MTIQVYSSSIGRPCIDRPDVPNLNLYDRFRTPVLNAKISKVLSHKVFPRADWTIWLDGNVTLNVSPESLVDLVRKSGCSVGAFPHWERQNIYQEAEICKTLFPKQKDDIESQIQSYGTGVARLAMCFLLIRRNTEPVRRANERWWADICTGSTRDQISFPVAFKGMWHALPAVTSNINPYFTRFV